MEPLLVKKRFNFTSLGRLKEESVEKYVVIDQYGIEDGFVQELSADGAWYPDFTKENPFSSELCRKIWHYNE